MLNNLSFGKAYYASQSDKAENIFYFVRFLCTFLRRNFPQNRISVQVGFNLQTGEIQTAIAVQSDSQL
jgi:hypothetical protein